MRTGTALGLAFLMAMSACLGAPTRLAAPDEAAGSVPPPVFTFGGTQAGVGGMITWQGRHLQPEPGPGIPIVRPDGGCRPSSCETVLFSVEHAAEPDLELRAMISWPFSTREGDFDVKHPSFEMRLVTPAGQTVAASESTYGALVRVSAPAAGRYQLAIQIGGLVPVAHAYQGFLSLDRAVPRPDVVEERLPDLALAFIGDLQLSKSVPGDFAPTTAPAPWTKGCGVDEFQESRYLRCLRFTASIANVGPGPLMLFFKEGEGTLPVTQCVTRSDGSTYLRPAGTGAWHEPHWHHHQNDVVDYRLYRYDLATSTRGEAASKGQKFGWGFAAQGVLPHVAPETYSQGRVFYPPREDCPALSGSDYSAYGLPRGWHDPYLFWRNGNFVDVTDVPDGVYELEVVLNAKGHVLEDAAHANDGSVLLRIRGDNVEQLTTFQRDFAPAAT